VVSCSFYQMMCNDDTPMVRRAAAANIGKVAAAMEKEYIASLILPLFRALTSDDQDSVRLLAIENSAAIAELLSQDENSMHVLPIVRSSVEDRSWRVRFSIAKDFFPLSRAMGTQITESELLGCFSNLLQVGRTAKAEMLRKASWATHELCCLLYRTRRPRCALLLRRISQATSPLSRTSCLRARSFRCCRLCLRTRPPTFAVRGLLFPLDCCSSY
jgi:hypothetical protein